MKQLIANKWKKILCIIGVCILACILIYKVTAEKSIIQDYALYGKVIESTNSDALNTVKDNFSTTWNSVDPGLIRLTVILIIAILAVVIITSFVSMLSGDKKDAKKK